MPSVRTAPMIDPAPVSSGIAATIIRLTRRVPPWHLAALGVLMLLASLMEGVGLMLLLPLIAVIGEGFTADSRVTALNQWLGKAGLALTLENLLIAFLLLVALRSLVQFLREQVGVRIERWLVDRLRSKA